MQLKVEEHISLSTFSHHKQFRSAAGGVLAALCGIVLWLNGAWENASYDALFRFGARPVTNQVTLILMDNEAHARLAQPRGQPWDRSLHANLLNRLAEDRCPLVVFDLFLKTPDDPTRDGSLAEAMRKQRQLVLMAMPSNYVAGLVSVDQPVQPAEPFLSAAKSRTGLTWLATNELDGVVRQHWPFPSPEGYPTLPWVAAHLAGAPLGEAREKRWLRYYGGPGPCQSLPYHRALSNAPGYFADKIVFIGSAPANRDAEGQGEKDRFRTPYTRWTGECAGGVEVLATEFLNLLNNDWLRRPPGWVELPLLVAMGMMLGGGLCRLRLWMATAVAAGIFVAIVCGAACLSYFSDYWFPWLVVAGGQTPVALVFAFATVRWRRQPAALMQTETTPPAPETRGYESPDYERFGPPFGEGGFGKVWVVRNAIGQWQALKEVYKDRFDDDSSRFDMEFNGIQNYKPVSHKHPGLLRIEFVSREKRAGFFYYVMELGDPLDPDSGWEQNPKLYRPLDLTHKREQAPRKRLPIRECAEIAIALSEALEFLHQEGLTHRDIKPANVIFVNGQPKLADAGTVTVLRPREEIHTRVVSRGFTPADEPGTRQADIFSLGKLLYVISTGRDAQDDFPALSTSLVDSSDDFMELNKVIVKACHPDLKRRYGAAEEMRTDLLKVLGALK